MEEIVDTTGNMVIRYGLSTFFLFLIIFIVRMGIHHSLFRATELSVETRRRWAVNLRNGLLFLFILGMIFIWAPQLQTFAVSVFAVAVAFVLATKEIIDCLSGSALRVLTKAYSLGDRIEIGGIRGNVVDHNALTTTVLEIGPGQTSHQYTGRAMVIPNSFIFDHPLTNETYTKKYRLHIVTVPLSTDDDWKTAERLLLQAGEEEAAPFIDEARIYLKKLEGKLWLDAPSVEPRVTIQLPEPGRINLLLRVPCPTQYPSRLEQAILRKFLAEFSFAPRLMTQETHSTH
ncbi:MAG: mechanosensitive ion channel family protein [Nitrospirales bacterium]|nr:mechanosensitive ion channel family protein [Nitrospirales bacterium]